jgi:hypothetical protein
LPQSFASNASQGATLDGDLLMAAGVRSFAQRN